MNFYQKVISGETSNGKVRKMRVFVADTSVIVDGRLTQYLNRINEKVKVIIPEAVVAEIEHQANEGKAIGHTGLEELKKLRKARGRR